MKADNPNHDAKKAAGSMKSRMSPIISPITEKEPRAIPHVSLMKWSLSTKTAPRKGDVTPPSHGRVADNAGVFQLQPFNYTLSSMVQLDTFKIQGRNISIFMLRVRPMYLAIKAGPLVTAMEPNFPHIPPLRPSLTLLHYCYCFDSKICP
jgi:hypothetical protein